MEAKKLGQTRAKLVRRSELLVFSWKNSPNYIWWFIRMARLKTDKVWYNTSCTIIFILSTFCYSRLRRRLSLNFNFTCLLRSVHYKTYSETGYETMRPMKTHEDPWRLTLWRSSFDFIRMASILSRCEKIFLDCIFLWKTRSMSPFPILWLKFLDISPCCCEFTSTCWRKSSHTWNKLFGQLNLVNFVSNDILMHECWWLMVF